MADAPDLKLYVMTRDDIVHVFRQWVALYLTEPEDVPTVLARLNPPATYAEACAESFIAFYEDGETQPEVGPIELV